MIRIGAARLGRRPFSGLRRRRTSPPPTPSNTDSGLERSPMDAARDAQLAGGVGAGALRRGEGRRDPREVLRHRRLPGLERVPPPRPPPRDDARRRPPPVPPDARTSRLLPDRHPRLGAARGHVRPEGSRARAAHRRGPAARRGSPRGSGRAWRTPSPPRSSSERRYLDGLPVVRNPRRRAGVRHAPSIDDYQAFIRWQFHRLHEAGALRQGPHYAAVCPGLRPRVGRRVGDRPLAGRRGRDRSSTRRSPSRWTTGGSSCGDAAPRDGATARPTSGSRRAAASPFGTTGSGATSSRPRPRPTDSSTSTAAMWATSWTLPSSWAGPSGRRGPARSFPTPCRARSSTPRVGTGVVMSVPAHAPADWLAVQELDDATRGAGSRTAWRSSTCRRRSS